MCTVEKCSRTKECISRSVESNSFYGLDVEEGSDEAIDGGPARVKNCPR